MRITQAHLAFWTQKHAPNWARHIKKYPVRDRVAIDACINAHAGIMSSCYLDASNLLSILAMIRKNRRAALRAELERISSHPGTVINPKRRAAFARKWLSRIDAQN